jgi:hypothetical protein
LHWPVVLLAPFAVGRELGPAGKLAAVGVTLVLSAASYEWVEKPFQAGRLLRAGRWRAFAFAACGMALIGAPGAALAEVWLPRLAERQMAAVPFYSAPCAGAQALLDMACKWTDPHGDKLLTSPLVAANDIPTTGFGICTRDPGDSDPKVCRFGVERALSAREVVLWGNSHARHWLPALELLAAEFDLSVTTYIASSCAPLAPDSKAFQLMADQSGCAPATVPELELILARSPDLVVLSNAAVLPDSAHGALVESSLWVLRQLTDAGIPVMVVKDNPQPEPTANVPNCLALHKDDPTACDGPREAWVQADPWIEAAERLGSPLVSAVDLDGGMCDAEMCYAVVGGIVSLYDDHHLTGTYVKSIAPQLGDAIKAAMRP